MAYTNYIREIRKIRSYINHALFLSKHEYIEFDEWPTRTIFVRLERFVVISTMLYFYRNTNISNLTNGLRDLYS